MSKVEHTKRRRGTSSNVLFDTINRIEEALGTLRWLLHFEINEAENKATLHHHLTGHTIGDAENKTPSILQVTEKGSARYIDYHYNPERIIPLMENTIDLSATSEKMESLRIYTDNFNATIQGIRETITGANIGETHGLILAATLEKIKTTTGTPIHVEEYQPSQNSKEPSRAMLVGSNDNYLIVLISGDLNFGTIDLRDNDRLATFIPTPHRDDWVVLEEQVTSLVEELNKHLF